jgi:hypothetical protein
MAYRWQYFHLTDWAVVSYPKDVETLTLFILTVVVLKPLGLYKFVASGQQIHIFPHYALHVPMRQPIT